MRPWVLLCTLLWLEQYFISSNNISDNGTHQTTPSSVTGPSFTTLNQHLTNLRQNTFFSPEQWQQRLLEKQLQKLDGNDTIAKMDIHVGKAYLPYNLTNVVGKVEKIDNITTIQYNNWASENQDLCTLSLLQGHQRYITKILCRSRCL